MTFNGITLTWATRVDPAVLGARMESYVGIRAPIHVFKLCVQRAPSEAPLGRLSPELVEMIATEVYDAAFNKHLKAWQQYVSCCEETCRRSEHLSEEDCELSMDEFQMDLESHLVGNSRCDGRYCTCPHNFDDWLVYRGIGDDEHTLPMEDFIAKVENNSYVEGSGSFAKCRKIIAQDFGLEAYFTAFRDYEVRGSWAYPPVTEISAYLILPSMHSPLRIARGAETISYLTSVVVNPSILDADHHDLFRVAMCSLQLEPVSLGQQSTIVVPTSQQLPDAHSSSWQCSQRSDSGDGAARKKAYTPCSIRLTRTEAAASSAWPKLMILGSGSPYIDE